MENIQTTHGDRVALVDGPVDATQALASVGDPSAGGIACFVGTVRAEQRKEDGVELAGLDYEAYTEMARKQLADMVSQARARWNIVNVVLLHSVGRLKVGQASVVIVVACPHRAEAFEACRWLIEMLKQDVTIWKQDWWSGDK